MRATAWFRSLGANNADLAGGKGAELGELTAAGLPDPPGSVVPSEVNLAGREASGAREKLRATVRCLRRCPGRSLVARPLISVCWPPRRYAVGSASSPEFVDESLDVCGLFADTGLPYRSTTAFAGMVTAKVTLPVDRAGLL